MATAIKRKPEQNVINLSAPVPTGELVYKVTFGLPARAYDSDNPARAEVVDVWWDVRMASRTNGRKTRKVRAKQAVTSLSSSMSQQLDLAGVIGADGQGNLTRSSYNPYTDWLLVGVDVYVHTRNSKGSLPWLSTQRNLSNALRPTISELVQDEDTGRVSFTVTKHDTVSTSECVYVDWDVRVRKNEKASSAKPTKQGAPGSSESAWVDVPERMQLEYGDYVHVLVTATGRGAHGDSEAVRRALYVSWPNEPTINSAELEGDRVTGKVTVDFDNNHTDQHPVTGVRLQKIVNCEYEDGGSIPGDEWQDVSVQDDGGCTALSVAAADVMPGPGRRSWLRVKQWNQHEGIFARYSKPIRLEKLESKAPTAADDSIIIVSAVPGDDGASADVLLAWAPEDSQDDSTGTELTWADSAYAWRSTKEPSSFSFDWFEAEPVTVGGVEFQRSATVHVEGLTEGKRYWFRARRVMEASDGTVTRGKWYPDTGEVTCTPTTAPSAVVLSAPSHVARGRDVQLTWSYDTDAPQRAWRLVTGEVGAERELMGGDDAMGSCLLPADRFASLADATGSLAMAVYVGTGGTMVRSQVVEVALADAPELSVSAADVTAQPLAVVARCSGAAELAVVVTAQGCEGEGPEGVRTQAAGDSVWSAVVEPSWSEAAGGGYEATVTAPEGLDLRDLASYDVSAIATDRGTGLSSEAATCSLGVGYARRAPVPTGVVVTPSDTTDDQGERSLSATVLLPESGSLAEGDLYDVWCVTPDGPRPVAEGVAPGSVVTDRWAPYGAGEHAYRVAVRTVDGCFEWDDFPYELRGDMLRVDFDGGYAELPYNVSLSDSWEKDFEARRKLDGSVDGYWNAGAARRAGLSTDVSGVDAAEAAAVRRLARHAGACLVRTPDGSRYQADVQVSGMATGGGVVSVTLDATEVSPTQDFMATIGEAS